MQTGSQRRLKHTALLSKMEAAVLLWARVAAGGTGLLVFLDDMSADRIFKMRLVCPDSKIAVITKEL